MLKFNYIKRTNQDHIKKKWQDKKCSQGYIQEHELEAQIKEIINQITIPPEFHQFAMKWLKNQHKKESAGRNAVLASQQRAYTVCLNKLEGLIDMRANKEITEDEYANKKLELLNDKNRLEQLLNDTGQNNDRWLEIAE